MMGAAMVEALFDRGEDRLGETLSIADLFLEASRELARSDSRIYRSVDRHLARTKEILNRAEADLELPLLPEAPANDLLLGEPSYERQTRKSLENLCRLNGIRGYSRMTKAGMISRLKAEGVPEPPPPLDAFTKIELVTLLEEAVRRLHRR
jgi:hypothetical protein